MAGEARSPTAVEMKGPRCRPSWKEKASGSPQLAQHSTSALKHGRERGTKENAKRTTSVESSPSQVSMHVAHIISYPHRPSEIPWGRGANPLLRHAPPPSRC